MGLKFHVSLIVIIDIYRTGFMAALQVERAWLHCW